MKNVNAPIFIIGMPRSGTKLLRSLLVNHDDIFIPSIETECLPSWTSKYSEVNFSDKGEFSQFYDEVTKSIYFSHQHRHGKQIIDKSIWFERSKGGDISKVFEELIKHDTAWTEGKIWGDKSPSYINHVTTIRQCFPNARIILIVRDVRDYCLSINKAWGKNIYRAAQRWYDSHKKVLPQVSALGHEGLTIKYEDLTQDPQKQLEKICNFIGIEFNSKLLSVTNSTENLGSAKGATTILSDNQSKWKKLLTSNEIYKIESYSWPILEEFQYEITHEFNKVSKISMVKTYYYKLADGYNLLMTNREKGILWNLRVYLRNMIDRINIKQKK
ncbi:sulfotransferase [Paraglaciecola sp.]|uniref:sulfotransferase family protein n=1 Tax=Paraglaciecola sp. TaxID=1920173 RepID=UPI00326676AB